MNSSKPYFFQAFIIVLLSAIFFMILKDLLPKKIFSEKPTDVKNVVIDSLLLEALALEKKSKKALGEEEKKKELFLRAIVFEESEGIKFRSESFDTYKGYQYLISFYEKLYHLETEQKGNVRIAYFGDSMTDGDLIVQDLRISFQQVFGGHGVGFVSMTSESAASRRTVIHQFSGNWEVQSYLNVKTPTSPFGINGHVFFVKDSTRVNWVKYRANNTEFSTRLYNPTLFYGQSNNKEGTVVVAVDKDTVKVVKKLISTSILNTLSISSKSIKEFKSEFIHADSIPFYGYNFDDGKGVHIDNFSSRGNSGLPISIFNTSLMRAFNDKLGYDLIILHYGTNVLNYGNYNYDWYYKGMIKVVEHLRECFLGVSVLIISTGDKGTKYGMEIKTDSAVIPLVRAQKNCAIKTESGFVNLYTLMGGDGSIVKWVGEDPVMASKDYTHFNFRGAKKVSDLLYKQLNDGYQEYKTMRKNRKSAVIDSVKVDDILNSKQDTINEG